MTDNDYKVVQLFLESVRQSYREALKNCDNKDEFRYLAQDNLSLFSPWMNNP